jgi:hypothetical protein
VIAGPGLVKDLKVKSSEKCGSLCLPEVECLSFSKKNKVLIIAEYIDRMSSSL